jgi:hypothetical protein
LWQEIRHNYKPVKEENIVKIALSIICISIFCVSFRGIIGYGRMIETDKPDHKEIKKNLNIVGGIIAILALLLLVLINIHGF